MMELISIEMSLVDRSILIRRLWRNQSISDTPNRFDIQRLICINAELLSEIADVGSDDLLGFLAQAHIATGLMNQSDIVEGFSRNSGQF